MNSFTYNLPVKIVFGNNTSMDIANHAAGLGKRCFVIADAFYRTDSLFSNFFSERAGLFCGLWTDVTPNPSIKSVREAVKAIKEADADFVLALGGGSALDTAKAACISARTGVDIEQFHTGKIPIGNDSLPLIALPTTAGTGSEVTPVSVLSNYETGFKGPVAGAALLPKIAIVDPSWTVTMPKHVTAATGMDALSHALEAYWTKNAFPICDAYAEKAVMLIMQNLLRAYNDGSDIEARTSMSLAALLAGMAFGQPKNAAVHACSFPLTGKYGMPHGTACAFTLDLFLKYNAIALPEKMFYISRLAGFGSVNDFADAIRDLKIRMDMPVTLKDARIGLNDLDSLVEASFHPLMNNNPVKVTREDLFNIYMSINED